MHRGDRTNYWHTRNLVGARYSRRKLIGGAGAAGLGLVGAGLVGCGDDDTSGTGSTNTPNASTPNDASATPGGDPTATQSPAEPARGGKVTMAISTADSLDPHRGFLVVTRNIFYAVHDGLVAFDSGLNVVPELATEWETPDGATYTLRLRENVMFHDGTPFNADAVVANFDRILDPATEAPDAAVFAGLTSYEAVDDRTVRFVNANPNADFMLNLTEKPGQMISPTALDRLGNDIGTEPVGAGPFKFDEWRRGDRINLSRFEDYWDEGYPLLDEVEFREIEDASVTSTALRSGDIDIGLPAASDLASFQDNSDFDMWSVPGVGNVSDIIFFPGIEPMGDPRVRRAILFALDREAINQVVYGGLHIVPHGIIPPSFWCYDPGIEGNGWKYDPATARELLSAAGVEDSLTFDNYINTGASSVLLGETMQAMLAEVGVTMNLQALEPSARVERQRQGDIQATNAGFSGRTSMDQFMTINYHSAGGFNYANFAPEPRDRLIEEARQTLDTEERASLYQELEREIVADPAPRIPHLFLNNTYFVRNTISQQQQAYLPDNMIRFKWIARTS